MKACLARALALVIVAAALSLCVGRLTLSPVQLWTGAVRHHGADADTAAALVWHVRLPRVLGALCVGAALSVSGATYQIVFRNPLVSPGLLGVLAGAGFGAASAIVCGQHGVTVELGAVLGGMLAAGLAILIAQLFDAESLLMLVFGGLIATALFTALLSSLQYMADPERQLPDIVFWLLGSLAAVTTGQIPPLLAVLMPGLVLLLAGARLLDALALGDDEARALGIPVRAVRLGALIVATMLSVVTVSVVGMIGWVGLVVPHLARLLVGPRAAPLLGMSALIGGLFLLVCDDIARGATRQEIPVGIVADLLGVAVFLALLRLRRVLWA
ncbi:Fe3+-siderophore ABC transporter permease [Ameyamaea chiangmaiensis NBRC 103196]|uniref:Iron ABC transporter permease n=1 Tax=Ameyamaea chiangmaiensis TaxID=442969 RepID=A0A850P9W9_9PROT|nr:iron ABC transporter permease [Ameyamaea chiangmaiensis]MBS4075961.1 iron ABC transporter permease [Ameyamaea chiangmaiensis]NVN39753.1 iron ABC transporter permease [Ameyamaea chiangmaiensis]GBQ61607.1 Fe3+-siderophore ABC transporter permease [Ameyamaea chiangmaiensis NBRC 103196]